MEGISVTIISGETRKTSQKLKLPTEIIPGETEFLWEGKVILVISVEMLGWELKN